MLCFDISVDTELTLVFLGSLFFSVKSLISLNSLFFLTALKIFLTLLLVQLNSVVIKEYFLQEKYW